MKIKKFFFICVDCQRKGQASAVNIAWHPNQAFIFTCYTCGEAEGVKVKDELFPENLDDFKKKTVMDEKCSRCQKNPATLWGGPTSAENYCEDCQKDFMTDDMSKN